MVLIAIDKLSYSNKLIHNHPVEKVIFSLGSLIIVLFSSGLVLPIGVLSIMVFSLLFRVRIRGKLLIRFFSIPLVFIFTGLLPILFKLDFTGRTSLVSLSSEGVVEGGLLLVKSISSISCFYFLILSTPIEQIDYFMGQLRISGLFREMILLVYRFIFLLLEMADKIYISQKQRRGYRRFTVSLRSFAMLCSSLLIRSINYCSRSYLAVRARGGNSHFTFLQREHRYSGKNIVLLTIHIIALILFRTGEALWPIWT